MPSSSGVRGNGHYHNLWTTASQYYDNKDIATYLNQNEDYHSKDESMDTIKSPNPNANGFQQQPVKEEEEKESFSYAGIDSKEEQEEVHSDSDSYSAKMREILGSDDEAEEASTSVLQQEEEESFQYPHPVPEDRSYSFQHPMHSTPRSVSASGSSSNRIHVLPTPQRPAAYPSISRLRSSVNTTSPALGLPRNSFMTLPGTSTPSSRYQRSPLLFEFMSPAACGSVIGPTLPSISSARSRNSSFSLNMSKIPGRKRKKGRSSFPYGTLNQLPARLAAAEQDAETATLRSEEILTNLGAGSSSKYENTSSILKETVGSEDGEWQRDFVRWSALRKISSQIYEKSALQGRADATVLSVAGGLVAVGTRGGMAIVFEFSQQVKCICGNRDIAASAGAVTALAFSSDHTFLTVGHASGHIYLYDLSSPSRPARQVLPVPLEAVKAGKREGHLRGSKIVHLGFIGLRHTAIVSADNKGLSFYHALGKILGVSSNDTLRLLGNYPKYEREEELGLSISKKSAIFGMAPLPFGPRPHAADQHQFIAILKPGKMVLVGLKPSARTWYRKVKPKPSLEKVKAEGTSSIPATPAEEADPLKSSRTPGCVAWFPAAVEADGRRSRQTNPVLAFSLGDRFHLIRLLARKRLGAGNMPSDHADAKMLKPGEEVEVVELTGKHGVQEKDDILAMQWFNPDLLMLVTKTGLALFDCRVGRVTERMKSGSAEAVVARLIEHGWYNSLLGLEAEPDLEEERVNSTEEQHRSWAVSHSVRVSKGKSFFLTRTELVVGTLLSWADRLLAYVSNGDFLSAIELATIFYQGKALGSAVGLPSDAAERKEIIGQKLQDLMEASTEYTFSPDRLTDSTHMTPDGRGVDRTSLFEGLARVCARACLALGDLNFLFNVLYDRYEDNGIEGIFVSQMEQFIVSGELRTLPIPVMQRLLTFRKKQEEYDLAERIIWHVDPKSLDLDQALSLCIDQKLYDAMIYVYNSALEDYVSPIIELLVPLKRILSIRRKVWRRLDDDSLDAEEEGDEQDFEDAYKIFSYLSVVLTGNQYPSQEPIAEERANAAKTSIYSFIFSGRCMIWPPGPGGRLVLFGLDEEEEAEMANELSSESIYPYLRLFLEFDSEAYLDALDLAFEDSFLDDEDLVGKRISRQLIVDILLELSNPSRSPSMSFDISNDAPAAAQASSWNRSALHPLSRTFINIFIARNAPKYPQFIKLTQPDVDHLLHALSLPELDSDPTGADESSATATTREDRQLATEYLLSTYKPEYDEKRMQEFEQAGFHRILQSAFRQAGKWDRLLAMFLRDYVENLQPQQEAFSHIEECLVKASGSKSLSKLYGQLVDSVSGLLDLNAHKAVALLDRFFPDKHSAVIARLDGEKQLVYLRCFFESQGEQSRADAEHLDSDGRELFIDLLAQHDPDGIVRNLDARGPAFFDLEIVISICRQRQSNGDAILWCLDRIGRPKEAFDELDGILGVAGSAMLDEGNEENVMDGIQKTVNMAVRLCIERANRYEGHDSDEKEERFSYVDARRNAAVLDTDEVWFRLLRSLVRLVHDVASSPQDKVPQALERSREIVQDTLSALVSSTAAEAVSFPDLFRRLIGDSGQTAKYYTEVRAVLEGMLGAYRLRADLLGITNKLFDRDTFDQFKVLNVQRKRGWRPMDGQSKCGRCGMILIGNKRGTMEVDVRPPLPAAEKAMARSQSLPIADLRRSSNVSEDERYSRPGSPASSRRASTTDSNLRFRVLRQGSSSSSLSIPQTPVHRRPRSPYDDKAAPLASPSINKGKGVIRNHLDSEAEGLDDYFSSALPPQESEPSDDEEEEGGGGAIVVLRSGEVYHQSCFVSQ